MPKGKKSAPAPAKKSPGPIRFAHPFYDKSAPLSPPLVKKYGSSLTESVASTLGSVPPTKGSGMFELADVIGQQGSDEIQAAGQIVLHVGGDSGVPEGDQETRQTMVSEEMAKDYAGKPAAQAPAFLLHLGDVIYGSDPQGFLSEFYRPYMHYPGKIVAIPGNHDGETSLKLTNFQANFCAPAQVVPPIAGSIVRDTLNEPGVYWCLDAPFVQIIGLYSNNAENPGSISGGTGGAQQLAWLTTTLTALKAQRTKGTRKALFIITHHPPYSAGGHSGSTQMLADIDGACAKAGITYDAFFSGHAHSLQRYSRTVAGTKASVPFIVSGCLGHGGQAVGQSPGPAGANPQYLFGYKGWGFTTVTISPKSFNITLFGVNWGAGSTNTNITTRTQLDSSAYPLI